MNNLDTGSILFLSGLGLFIWIFVVYWTVRSANSTSKRDKIQLQNQRILALLAEKMGVTKEDLKKVMYDNY